MKIDKINRDIESLESRGFNIKVTPDITDKPEVEYVQSDNLAIKIDKGRREIIVNRVPDDFSKTIIVRGKNYKLRSESWDYETSSFPAIRKEGEITIINESYPLFKNRQFDTFLKIHLLLSDYQELNLISLDLYKKLCEDLIVTFENH